MNSALETAAHLQNQDVEASNKSTGGRFGGGDMHEHLIRMGKQLAEIEAEHHQLFSGRQTDRDNLAKATARYFSGVQSRVDPLAGGLSPQVGSYPYCTQLFSNAAMPGRRHPTLAAMRRWPPAVFLTY
ncbi:hypothetical protein HaLaN_16264, partial [Haematococcus lacustris]